MAYGEESSGEAGRAGATRDGCAQRLQGIIWSLVHPLISFYVVGTFLGVGLTAASAGGGYEDRHEVGSSARKAEGDGDGKIAAAVGLHLQ